MRSRRSKHRRNTPEVKKYIKKNTKDLRFKEVSYIKWIWEIKKYVRGREHSEKS